MDFLRLHVSINNTIYINKEICDKIGSDVKATTNGASIFLFNEELSLDEVLQSLESIRQDVEYMQKKEHNNGNGHKQ